MVSNVVRAEELGRRAQPSEITLNPQFEDLVPGLSADDRQQIESALVLEGCREPLLVWPWQERLILLVGYELFPALSRYKIPFRIVEKPLGSWEEARLYVIRHHLARRNLTPLACSYLRGLRYHAVKQPHGGDHRSAEASAGAGSGKTAEALAEIFHVSPATIRRDAALVVAVDQIVANCGREAKALLLGRAGRLNRDGILALARLPARRQRHLVMQLILRGHLPRNWRTGEAPLSITLPREPRQLAKVLLQRLGRKAAEEVLHALEDLLRLESWQSANDDEVDDEHERSQ